MLTFAEAARLPATETADLSAGAGSELLLLTKHGARGMFIPAAFEEQYYRNVNLPEQLRRLFNVLNPARIDEDVLDPLCQRAQTLVQSSALLDDSVQLFYRALQNAGLTAGEIHVRRLRALHTETANRVIPPGTAALHAVKRLWANDWAFENVLTRLDSAGSVALEARPTLLLAGPPGVLDPALAQRLGVRQALVSPLGLVGAF